jgi:hypothetical protein
MTQQYILGEFSSLLAGLEPTAGELGVVVRDLRRQIERSPLHMLPPLAREALNLADMVCWVALEGGDVGGFCRCAVTAAALQDFTANANLLP